MSVTSAQLNNPGLSRTTFGKTKKSVSVSSQAAQNLSTMTSTSNTSGVFSFRKSASGFVAGRNTIKGGTRYNYQNARAQLNPRGFRPPSGVDEGAYVASTTTNFKVDMGTFGKGQKVGMAIMTGMATLNMAQGLFGTFGLVSSGYTSAGSNLNNAMSSLGNSPGGATLASGTTQQAIFSMQNATDSATLNSAILNAQGQMRALEYVNEDATKRSVTDLETNIKKLETSVANAEKDKKAKENDVSSSKNEVNIQTEQVNNRKFALKTAMTTKGKCSNAYAQAHANTVAAQQTLDSIDPKIQQVGPDGTIQTIDNPAYEAAQKNLDKMKKAEEQAKTDLDKANEDVTKADNDVKAAEETLKKEQEKLDKANEKLKKAEADLETAEKTFKTEQEKLDTAQQSLDKIQSDKQDYTLLKESIAHHQTRLQKLEQQEQEKHDKLSAKIDKQDAKAKNKILKSGSYHIGTNGEELRTGNLPSGKQVYFIGNNEVTQDEYMKVAPNNLA